ncbi:concanavalin A-like lectin/glucanase [Delitschia confertaspora ATCC 74209]|uniref:Concanavalin A-like lectin/glucanase n=1 Tax=Delitschia confertaspora ATCC 74209 TaxID=1513339 RepID=A0A9P4JRI2_9PLEO|nr:concanavalin A-like lectin/glucanase [Delitschia confertaspora ATCC 74209]
MNFSFRDRSVPPGNSIYSGPPPSSMYSVTGERSLYSTQTAHRVPGDEAEPQADRSSISLQWSVNEKYPVANPYEDDKTEGSPPDTSQRNQDSILGEFEPVTPQPSAPQDEQHSRHDQGKTQAGPSADSRDKDRPVARDFQTEVGLSNPSPEPKRSISCTGGAPFNLFQTPSASLPVSKPVSIHSPAIEGTEVRERTQSRQSETQPSEPRSSESTQPLSPTYFKSRRIKKEDIQRPWLNQKDPRAIWVNIIPIMGFIIGLGIAAFLMWTGYRSVSHHRYCEIMYDNFTSGWNDKIWTREIEVGGFGSGQFEQTTNSSENIFIEDSVLNIRPTLQNPWYISNNYTIDLRGQGCTGKEWWDCVATTNTTNGTIVNPVKSARISTKIGASIKFGRVEVVAQLPEGDWLWPAIWMLPKDNKYGPWPRSGEIDIMESRGNHYSYKEGGNNIVSSTLHFGPNPRHDGWWRHNRKQKALHTTYSKGFHTYGVEWTEEHIFTYIDSRLLQIMYIPFKRSMYETGRFPLADNNGTWLRDPWAFTGRKSTPFDENFYLIIDLAVGGTNGWFKDGLGGKPWIDTSPYAKREFWEAREKWRRTWKEEGRFRIKSVRMLQQEGHNGCYEK